MGIRTKNHYENGYCVRPDNDALRLAVRLVASQLSNGINLREAVQFAAKYHNVTCSAIERELAKKGGGVRSRIV